MRLKGYITEINRTEDGLGRSVSITNQQVKNKLLENCKNSLRSTPIYRGISNGSYQNALFIEPSKYTRRSEYTQNYYMLLFQLLKSWSGWPNLSHSLIGVTSENSAKSWGSNSYRVYPYDGYDIAVCSFEHFWGSFSSAGIPRGDGMYILNEIIEELILNHIDLPDGLNPKETDPQYLKNIFDKIDKKYMNSEKWYNSPFSFFGGEKILDTFNNLLKPNYNGFKLINTGSKWTIDSNKEIFTEAPCVLINIRTQDDELKKYL